MIGVPKFGWCMVVRNDVLRVREVLVVGAAGSGKSTLVANVCKNLRVLESNEFTSVEELGRITVLTNNQDDQAYVDLELCVKEERAAVGRAAQLHEESGGCGIFVVDGLRKREVSEAFRVTRPWRSATKCKGSAWMISEAFRTPIFVFADRDPANLLAWRIKGNMPVESLILFVLATEHDKLIYDVFLSQGNMSFRDFHGIVEQCTADHGALVIYRMRHGKISLFWYDARDDDESDGVYVMK